MPSVTGMPKPADIQGARNAAGQGPANVVSAVREASAKTGVDFAYLMEKAAAESGLRTDVKASTSSATGLYQFIDSTWLNTMAQHGAKHGMAQYASAIRYHADGSPYVADPAMRQEILELRKDPRVSSLLAAEFARDNKDYLEQNLGGRVGPTEMYLAHFLGPAGATKFLQAMKQNPDRAARDLFPDAAATNRGVFFTDGRPTTLREIYERFAAKFDEDGGAIVTSATVPGVGKNTEVSGNNPLHQITGQPLSLFTILTLNALETPLDDEHKQREQEMEKKHVRDEMNPVKPLDGETRGMAI